MFSNNFVSPRKSRTSNSKFLDTHFLFESYKVLFLQQAFPIYCKSDASFDHEMCLIKGQKGTTQNVAVEIRSIIFLPKPSDKTNFCKYELCAQRFI